MRQLYSAINTEILKACRSKILWISILLFVFMGIMIGMLMFISKHPEIAGKSAALGTKARLLGKNDWPSYFDLMIQMVLTVGCMGCGIVTIWVFGREYMDRVVKDLLVLPVPRHIFVSSKFILIIIWSLLLLLLLFASAVITGLIVNLDGWTWVVVRDSFVLYIVSSLLTILLCTPVGLITCLSRGYLLPVTFVFLTLILTQFVFVAVPGIILYFPWAIPALYSGLAGSDAPHPGFISYSVLILTSVACMTGTAAWWRYADQK